MLIGTRDFELRTSRNKVLQILVTFTVANLVLETLNIGDLNLPGLTFRSFNTPDILDALYGIGAITLIALVYGRRTHMFGHFVKK